MFKKILIANRGEIACRVIRSAQKMGIATVAVYSDADARSPHVEMADEAVHIGPPPAAESYLLADKIIAACKETGAEAVHPGYGFLSERESFAKALDEAGITFIGPPPAAIAAMGDKIESKKLAKKAGVSVVPGHVGEIDDTEHAVKISSEIGYPVMMKASAGGGGKGMRLAWNEQDVREGFEATKREGLASFGDDRVFIEKFIEQPRHIEIQVLGDKHGNIVYLGERECSIQRRHQKVVEEAPSPFVDEEMRKAMGEQAVALAAAVDYHSAGTVELIVGADKSFYFLEMNTRLQVEHPVTENVTGVDLVEQMIRVAAGEKLPFKQGDITLNGWSVENRVYAEDPYRGFLPSIGRLVRYNPPVAANSAYPERSRGAGPSEAEDHDGEIVSAELDTVSRLRSTRTDTVSIPTSLRVDDGVAEGGEVSMFYDPMIAKLITYAETREAAIDLQIDALDRFELEGLGHNLDFLSALMQHPRFRSGEITTNFIAEEYPDGFEGAPADETLLKRLSAIAGFAAVAHSDRARRVSGQLDGPLQPPADWVVEIDGSAHDVHVDLDDVSVDGEAMELAMAYAPGDRMIAAEFGGEALTVKIRPGRYGFTVTTRGASHEVRTLPKHFAHLVRHMIEKEPPDLSKFLLCPMPGLITALHVGEGDKVEAGQPLAVVEAMKMENILRAEKAGVVSTVAAAEGDSLQADDVILEFE
ncbi:acetyl/propionyl/methylcrotonyl-CoA carboxylase subunit alpha [Parasphingopyxis algicola]|uniref:acetyl-CoA carboxylase biotin carboxylase subunit n=1 Tax=Parasphingopyxis algicola TaxID=2026624 RepID=UPI0015A10885|nr:acetyl/propionyl/methylcrotonyl-CoA carboxylase subunit alpha [Parasphingopyxis algicola]QLC24566.1 acetyl/propionyl/methylcrotonyl-CoA carboxylase subunit alpha [Parasphingopyxis algicola]